MLSGFCGVTDGLDRVAGMRRIKRSVTCSKTIEFESVRSGCRNRCLLFVDEVTVHRRCFQTRWRIVTMSRTILVSLPVTNLDASMAFYQAIGFQNNPQFTDKTAAFMVLSETINVMLLTHAKWKTLTRRPLPPRGSSEAVLAVSCDSCEAVDAMNEAAAANGGTADVNPVQDLGFMYTRDFADPDDHIWGAIWMNTAAMPTDDQTRARGQERA